MDTIKIENKAVKMVAHRGLSGIEKENTCSAFVAACNRATYFAVETDVHRTVDGQFVIFHDDNTARVGLDHLVIEESTFETLRKLQLVDIDGKRGRIDLTIPTLMEYIEICKKYGKHCVLELKNEFKASDVYKIVSMIEKAGYLDHVIFHLVCPQEPDLPAPPLSHPAGPVPHQRVGRQIAGSPGKVQPGH